MRLVKDSQVYQMGEPIELEISYSSPTVKKYLANLITPIPDVGGVNPHLSPAEGVIDLHELTRDYGGYGGSFPGGPAFLGTQPITQRFDLTAWYRIAKPGQYSVTVTSEAVLRMKSAEEGGGRENLKLESNAVTFDILPPDPSWEAAQLADITQAVAAARNPGQLIPLAHRLAILDTAPAIQKLVALFLNSSDDSDGSAMYSGIRESSQTDLIISLLHAAISDPEANIPPRISWLLAEFQTRKELGIPPPVPMDPSERLAWNQKINERNAGRDKYLASAVTQLRASVQHRKGPQRAEAIYQSWYEVENLNFRSPQPVEVLSQLHEAVLDAEHELVPSERIQFITTTWKTMPHEHLLPMIRNLSNETGRDAWFYAGQAFQYWCEGWPGECQAEILRRAIESDPLISQYEIFMIPEVEHPELDKMLEGKLADSQFVWSGASSVDLSALVLRTGSRNLVSAVDATLDRYTEIRRFMCEPQAYFVAYLFRFAKEDAGRRLSATLQGATDPCRNQMLRFLEKSRYSDDLVPFAIQALDSQDPAAAASSATFLGNHAPESAKAAIWKRLGALWGAWRDRAGELKMQESTSPLFMGNSAPAQALMLQAALASALANATNWKLSEAERDRLRSGCLTEQCRTIADGKMRLSM